VLPESKLLRETNEKILRNYKSKDKRKGEKRKQATFAIKILKILQPENHLDLGTK
jgi:hypothetical protein